MSELSAPVTTDHFQYLAERTAGDDRLLRDLKLEAKKSGLPPIWIAPEQASFIQILLKLTKARVVIEVGTLAGYSAIWMARALPEDGKVHTIEISGRHADFAERWVAKSDVANRIRIYRGAGRDFLPNFRDNSADAAFIDADKHNYPFYLQQALRIVRSGGLIMVDNAFAFGQLFADNPGRNDVEVIRSFNEIMAGETLLQSVIAPIGDGLWIGVKLPQKDCTS
jgi:predicted O-methyltransferase YrrM